MTFDLSVAAVCDDGAVRLSIDDLEPGSYELEGDELARGRVEVCVGGRYREICRDMWDYGTASVVCSTLGFSQYGEKKTKL